MVAGRMDGRAGAGKGRELVSGVEMWEEVSEDK
jgi:hypothetical protein